MNYCRILYFAFVFFAQSASAQLTHGGVLTAFTNCPNENIVAFKNGTSCTAASYNFYRTDLNANFIGTALFSTTNTQEINAFGINPVDKFIYGFLFDRTPACAFQNVHLIRLGANGAYNDLGTIDLPAGYSLNTANGCVTQNGDFLFSASNGGGFYAGIVSGLTTMTDNAAYLIPCSLRLITFNTIATKFSDWAVHPYNGRIYTYGMFTENGKSKGQLVEIDLVTNKANAMGIIDSVLLTDPTRDNFGGVFFGQDNNLYGGNVFDRKLYKIDFATGAMSVAGTFAGGSGQIRCDMGSCASGTLVLPLQLLNFEMTENNNLLNFRWNLSGVESVIATATLEESEDGIHFIALASLKANSYQISSAAKDYFYRLHISTPEKSSIYSQLITYKTGSKNVVVKHYNGQLNITPQNSNAPVTIAVYTITGNLLKQQVLTGATNYSLLLSGVPAGNIVIVKATQGISATVKKIQW